MKQPKNQQTLVNSWNHRHAIGTTVLVTLDDGSVRETKTTGSAWVLGGHTAVIMLDGISGAYMLSRVEPKSFR